MKKLSPKEYLARYLQVETLSLSVHRAIEAKNIATVIFARPILDLGCGYGEFAGVFFDSKVEIGVDISWEELLAAQKSGKYEKLAWADARDLPFGNNYFGTVLSVSTLEHIEGVGMVISEVFRVLRPGGKFVFTVNTNKINKFLFWPKVLRGLGLPGLGQKYPKLYHRIFKHKTLWTAQRWKAILEKAGFEVKEAREIFSPAATAHFDRFLVTAWPAQLGKFLTGRRWVWRPKLILEWLVERYAGLVEQREKEGSNLFVVAVKPKGWLKNLAGE